ncbi:amino acid ABC transporter substrate-binding protein [Taibaiella lutea]|uniref:Amino acid ABC transporter substrate-binding protein n=1 Tax=Taibaiella lutea TaxID=2608001 RepID=A0A5M6CNL6_9BACT|nr:ABC transporter substrate-binding protein [Taibaiella lutea]KAA5536667.1 amino acid ABC transporter substrate-binding protein [Taibaiella lutea]
MRKIVAISFLTVFCLFTSATISNAQFWKKLFGKEEPKSNKPAPKKDNKPIKQAPVEKKQAAPEYPATQMKAVYRVDVLLPLYLNTLVKDGKAVSKKSPEYAMGAINFYEGISIAAEAMNKQHLKLEINIHDITEANEKPEILIKNKKLDSTDLIIAYVQSNDIPELAAFAKKKKINFVSALSPADADTKDNPYFILIQSTLNTHLNQLVSFASNKYSKNPKFILYSKNTGGEKEAYQQIKTAIETDKNTTREIDCSQFNLTAESLAKHFDSTKVNVLFVSTLDIELTEKILNTLAAMPSSYHFEIFGMPSWKYLKGLTQSSAYMKLSIHYTTPFYYDPTTAPGKYVNTEYGLTYGGEPSEFVYRGYESMYWLCHLLTQYGTIFNTRIKDVSAAPFTRFEIKNTYSEDNDFLYLENNKLYILHYQNGGYVVE